MGTAPVDRRVRKTRAAIRDAFIELVLERGYESVTVEDIADRADVARANFYKHYADKDMLLACLFEELAREVTERIEQSGGASDVIRTSLVRELYAHAERHRD